jgi:hypothetical protein
MDYQDCLNYQDDYDILDDDELYMLSDEHIIERMEAQSKRRNPPTIKRVKNEYG